ncbi:TlpA family protein disulfide reductase [Virgisporangium aurantiacum]|uniref:TlpA family protein disulfide reductase n=1 Tax=Virgisporangium aurantiacum TaxID=175570 RepID=UPI0019508E4C|nr:TlpA disulfide reductase family protein [Virgisporangium aurantiacum]
MNLVFSFGVIRRLREHTEILNRRNSRPDRAMMLAGGTVGEFSVVAVDGEAVSRRSLGAGTLVSFVSTACPTCVERLPELVRFAEEHAGPVLCVVVGSGADAAAMTRAFDGIATVVAEPVGGPMAGAFDIQAFPTFGLLDAGGVVRASGFAPSALAASTSV